MRENKSKKECEKECGQKGMNTRMIADVPVTGKMEWEDELE